MSNSMDTTQTQERPASEQYKYQMLSKVPITKNKSKLIPTKSKEVELQYRIFSFTSEEEEGKVENLSLGSDYEGNPGWHSRRF